MAESILKYFQYIQKDNKAYYFNKLEYATLNLREEE